MLPNAFPIVAHLEMCLANDTCLNKFPPLAYFHAHITTMCNTLGLSVDPKSHPYAKSISISLFSSHMIGVIHYVTSTSQPLPCATQVTLYTMVYSSFTIKLHPWMFHVVAFVIVSIVPTHVKASSHARPYVLQHLCHVLHFLAMLSH